MPKLIHRRFSALKCFLSFSTPGKSNSMDSEGNVEDSSWTTISIMSDECGYSSGSFSSASTLPEQLINKDLEDGSLDDTIPLDELDEAELYDEWKSRNPVNIAPSSQKFVVWADSFAFAEKTPTTLKKMDACAIYPFSKQSSSSAASVKVVTDSRSKHLANGLENQFLRSHSCLPVKGGVFSYDSPLRSMSFLKQPASRETSNFNPRFNSTALRKGSDLSEFKPQRCSTATNEYSLTTEFKPRHCSSALQESSASFVPLRCSTGISGSAAFNPPLSSTTTEYKTPSHKALLQENTSMFVPLRTSTGLNESAVFNPPMSSTACKVDDSNIPEFNNLKVFNENELI